MAALFPQHYARLVERRDFALFEELAHALPEESGDRRRALAALEELLRPTVATLAGMDDGAGAAPAIDHYVAALFRPRRMLGLDLAHVDALAGQHGIRNRLATATVLLLEESGGQRQTGSTSPPPDSSKGAAAADSHDSHDSHDSRQRPERSHAPNELAFGNEFVTFADVCDILANKRARRDITIIMLGLETAGKTFFVRRLKAQLRGTYVLHGRHGAIDFTANRIDRTKGVRYYHFRNLKRRRPSLHLFDLPGEAFRSLAQGDEVVAGQLAAATLDPAIRHATCALLADSQVTIVVEPALEVLDLMYYADHGDAFDSIRRRELRDDLRLSGDPQKGPPSDDDIAARAEEQLIQRRQLHVGLVRDFHSYFAAALKKVNHYRVELRPLIAARDAKALEDKAKVIADTPFHQLPDHDGPLPIAGLHLLSRADEYARLNHVGGTPFDRDPAVGLIDLAAAKRFEAFALSFEVYSTDFITSEPMKGEPTRDFLESPGSAGFDRLVAGWIEPAVRLLRRPRWRRLGSAQLATSGAAIRLRRWVDPRFRETWKERVTDD